MSSPAFRIRRRWIAAVASLAALTVVSLAILGLSASMPKAEEAPVMLIMVANPRALEENMDRMLDSWQQLGYIKPEMRETYKGMAINLYGPADSLKRKYFAVKNTALFAVA